MNSENKKELETQDTIQNMGNGLGNKISDDTIKKWTKNCPKCGREQIYKSQINLKVSIGNNTLCKSCRNFFNSKKGFIHSLWRTFHYIFLGFFGFEYDGTCRVDD